MTEPLTPEFKRGIAFCVGVLHGVADGIRDNTNIRQEQRHAAAATLNIIEEALAAAIKDMNDAQPR